MSNSNKRIKEKEKKIKTLEDKLQDHEEDKL